MNTTGYYDPISAVRPILPGGSEAWRFELNHFQGGPAVCDFNKMMPALADACFDDMTREPCDDRDDGFNKTSSVPVLGHETDSCAVWFEYARKVYVFTTKSGWTIHIGSAHVDKCYLGITYKIGDTTTFSAGPYDESLGVPVAVHFKTGKA